VVGQRGAPVGHADGAADQEGDAHGDRDPDENEQCSDHVDMCSGLTLV
jgi:hypothetical protein